MNRAYKIIGLSALIVVLPVIIYSVLMGGGDGARVAAHPDDPAGGQIVEPREYEIYTEWPFDAEEAKRRQIETAEVLGIPVEKTIDLGEGVKLEMVLIPAGEFMMGSPNSELGRWDDEGPMRRVRITKPFYMGRYPVTQAQWRQIMGTTVAQQRDKANPDWTLRGEGSDNPMYYVSWNDAQGFIDKAGNNLRLPTEAEWEYACRAGTSTRFYSGDLDSGLDGVGWYGGNSGSRTHPVGLKTPNAWELYDIHGNIWEYVSDWWQGNYHDMATTNPTGPRTGEYHVIRGGCWSPYPRSCRSAARSRLAPDDRLNFSGFRVVSPTP